ncbi:haloacid dehalogenase superfamily, subfamily IA, variant 3 with third motif having DD or ED [Paraburkholderia fungorum]|uniref:Haloacid dehalogenase superfamily, subfamily IA, variant 3 with third motif having DD or ED n=1 Tax=Paraburkholderia fungorum TaxID=134537 RepID=A0A1H1JDL4_9BURK|nr:HAD family hydrolase [Paraburkholderia fungorum]SDR47548.1 haloacid dehalogenase superfamily, subfamily IA, variant 3 with third motif having DD or ED [Paraburkholderia fungorum]
MQALIFDVDGTLADTETAHRDAFNAAFSEARLDWFWDEPLYARLLKVAGGKERLLHYWHTIEREEAEGPNARECVMALHALKTAHYAGRVRDGGLPLRPGIARLIDEARAHGVRVAIATTTTPANLDALLQSHFGAAWRTRFAAIGDGGTTATKKPAPDVYFHVLDQLELPASACVAFEDSANGLLAARAAGIPTVVTPTRYTAADPFDGALAVLPHLGDPHVPIDRTVRGEALSWLDLATLRRWHRDVATPGGSQPFSVGNPVRSPARPSW